MRKTKDINELKEYKTKYEKASGLHVPMEYILENDVYIFIQKNRIVAGFIIGTGDRMRTLDTFTSQENFESLNAKIDHTKYSEVCCFWASRNFRKSAWNNAMLWMKMAFVMTLQSRPNLMYGTNNRGLANLYGYPRKSILFHTDEVNNKKTFIFVANRFDSLKGILEIIIAKALRRNRKTNLNHKIQTVNNYEISI